ncbi:MAG: trypsin-like serine protease [Marinosulfonomonas sp.]|nr:trypsin-like serine protease [Marinosulfonomonas sp.]
MRQLFSILVFLASFSSAGFAEEPSSLRTLLTGDDSRGWEAVGRLNIAGRNMCTGALIAPDLVLTAAHCVFNKASGQMVDATKIEFLAGWRGGRASAYANVKRAVVHPDYVFAADSDDIRVRNDLAVLQLTRPINKSSITPFQTDVRPRKGANVGIVSYAHDRAESPSIQESCRVLARQSGTLIMSCDVDFGSSGAPVFLMNADGVPRIVSVVSAMANVNGRKVSLGMSLEEPLADILAELKATEGPFLRTKPVTRRMSTQGGISRTGAKFLRP